MNCISGTLTIKGGDLASDPNEIEYEWEGIYVDPRTRTKYRGTHSGTIARVHHTATKNQGCWHATHLVGFTIFAASGAFIVSEGSVSGVTGTPSISGKDTVYPVTF